MRLILLIAVACADDPIVQPPPFECGAGQIEADGICRWVLPTLPCPPHSRPQIGASECQPVGPGPCAAPFESDGSEWGCRAIAPDDCPAGTAPILGSSECEPVGWSDCPPGFAAQGGSCADVLPAALCSGATYAQLGQTECLPIGDCSAPFPPSDAIVVPADYATIGEAIAAAPSGSRIAVDAGTYQEAIVIEKPLALVGRCAEMTIVETSTAPVLRAAGEAVIGGFTFRGGQGVVASAMVSLDSVVIEGASDTGLLAIGPAASVVLSSSAVRTVRSNSAGARGRGASAQQGAHLSVRGSQIDDVREGGVVAAGAGTTAEVRGTVITRVRPSTEGNGGEGIISAFGASMMVIESVIAETAISGILAVEAAIEASDVVVRDINPGPGNAGIRVEDASRFTGERVSVRRAVGAAVLANNPGTIVELSDSLLAETIPDDGFSGGALAVQSAELRLSRVRVEETSIGALSALDGELVIDGSAIIGRAQSIGILVQGASTEVTSTALLQHELAGISVEEGGRAHVDRTLIRGVPPRGLNSSGIYLISGSSLRVEHSAVVGNDAQGIIVIGASSATIADSLVEAIRMGPRAATAIGALDGSRLWIERTRVEDVDGIGVLSENGPLMVADSAILSTREISPVTPTGIAAGGTTEIVGSALIDNAGVGIVLGGGTTALDGVLIADTRALSDGRFGHGLVAESATVAVERSAFSQNTSVATFFDRSRGLVDTTLLTQNGVGVHVQSGSFLVEGDARTPDGFEVLFTPAVVFFENQTRVGTGTLPIPDPFEALP